MNATTFPSPEWAQILTHRLYLDGNDAAPADSHTGTLAGAQNAARALSNARVRGVTIRSGNDLTAYLNTARPEGGALCTP